MGIGNDAGDRARNRDAKYRDEIDKLEGKIKRLETERSLWTQRALKAETEVMRVRSEQPFRSAIVRVLDHLADRLR